MNYLNINLGAFGIIATILAIAATVVAFVINLLEKASSTNSSVLER